MDGAPGRMKLGTGAKQSHCPDLPLTTLKRIRFPDLVAAKLPAGPAHTHLKEVPQRGHISFRVVRHLPMIRGAGTRTTRAGRCRTSLEGGNRGVCRGGNRGRRRYGDLTRERALRLGVAAGLSA